MAFEIAIRDYMKRTSVTDVRQIFACDYCPLEQLGTQLGGISRSAHL